MEDWLIKGPADYAPVIAMLDDTNFCLDRQYYLNLVRDMGSDGLIRGEGGQSAFEESVWLFGLVGWCYAQYDQPELFRKLLAAMERRLERFFPLALESPAEFVALGSLSDEWGGPDRFREFVLPFYRKHVPLLKAKGKICSIHAHNSNLKLFADVLAETGVQVIEAYTPAPISNLSISEARRAWGRDTVIWVNFPETIFWSGREATRRYTLDLLENDSSPERLVLGMTELGAYGIDNDVTERAFKEGIRAILDAIDDFSGSAAA